MSRYNFKSINHNVPRVQETNGLLRLLHCQAADDWNRVPGQLSDSGQGLREWMDGPWLIYGHESIHACLLTDCIVVWPRSPVSSAGAAACVLRACWRTAGEAVWWGTSVPASTTTFFTPPEKASCKSATPGESLSPSFFPYPLHPFRLKATCSDPMSSIHSTCRAGRWLCTKRACDSTCMVHGEGHYTTFDDKKFFFHGDCNYVLAQVWHISSFYGLASFCTAAVVRLTTCFFSRITVKTRRTAPSGST